MYPIRILKDIYNFFICHVPDCQDHLVDKNHQCHQLQEISSKPTIGSPKLDVYQCRISPLVAVMKIYISSFTFENSFLKGDPKFTIH